MLVKFPTREGYDRHWPVDVHLLFQLTDLLSCLRAVATWHVVVDPGH